MVQIDPVNEINTMSNTNNTIWKTQRNKAEVVHSASHLGFQIEIRNYVGSRSMEGFIFRNGSEWFRIQCDKREWLVASLKQELVGWLTDRLCQKPTF